MLVPFSEGQGKMSRGCSSTIRVQLPPVVQNTCLLWLHNPHTWRESWGSHAVLYILDNNILQMCTKPLVFICSLYPDSHVVRQPFWCEDVKALAISNSGPTDIFSIATGEMLVLKKEDTSEKAVFVNVKALLTWVVQHGLDLVQALIRWLGYFCSSLWTPTVVGVIYSQISVQFWAWVSVKQFAPNCNNKCVTAEYDVRISKALSPASIHLSLVLLVPALS